MRADPDNRANYVYTIWVLYEYPSIVKESRTLLFILNAFRTLLFVLNACPKLRNSISA
jgi:hypothetical protein